MRISLLKLNDFRNYSSLEFTPGEGLNILYGQNAQGKSNILEALSLLATTRSLRAGRESEMVQQGAESANVIAEVVREDQGDAEIQVTVFQGDKKAVRVNGMKRPRVLDLLGQFNAVFFGSIDLCIVTGEPSDRRHYLNIEISQISPRYVYDLGHYKRVLEQRNRLLRDMRDNVRRIERSELETWNEQLIKFGSTLFEKRRFYIERLAPLATRIHRDLTDGKETLELRYSPSIPLPPEAILPARVQETVSAEMRYMAAASSESSHPTVVTALTPSDSRKSTLSATELIAEEFKRQLERAAPDERRRGTTLLGPQRDDILFFIDGNEARIFGSQGQQRTVALSLKLAEFQLIEDYIGEPPVMLLDDVMSDLDDARRRHLLTWVRRRCQTFITCTSLRSFPKEILQEAAAFKVVEGTVTPDVGTIRSRVENSKKGEFKDKDVVSNGSGVADTICAAESVPDIKNRI